MPKVTACARWTSHALSLQPRTVASPAVSFPRRLSIEDRLAFQSREIGPSIQWSSKSTLLVSLVNVAV